MNVYSLNQLELTKKDDYRKVEYFCSNRNNHYEFPDVIYLLPNLTALSLHTNHLSKIPELIFLVPRIEHLDLSYNNFVDFPKEILVLTKLTYLDLSHNKIGIIPDFISELKNLKKLYLDNTNIETLPLSICDLKHLSYVYLRHNRIQILPELPSSCKDIDITHNELIDITIEPREMIFINKYGREIVEEKGLTYYLYEEKRIEQMSIIKRSTVKSARFIC